MNVFGLTIARKSTVQALRTVPSWWASIREPFTGAWQRNVECESPQNILAFSAVYACVSLIADDIAKLRIKLMQRIDADLSKEITDPKSPFLAVLRKPNRYQTRIQFINQWVTCKLLYGNAYVLLERDGRRVVTAQYVLDPRLVTVLVASDGSVLYRLKVDNLSGIDTEITVPASSIIHDRMTTPWHPLIGISPIYASGSSATQGIRIQGQSAKFFENRSLPSGMLTAPDEIPDETAARLKAEFEQRFGGANLGRLFVAGSGLKYERFTMPAVDAQLIQQLEWTVADVARPFKMPLHKLGMGQPTLNNIGALNQDYYSQCLQKHIEDIEALEDEALGLPALGYGVELDLDGLLRMDPISRADKNEKAIRAGYLAPNEARRTENLPPVDGGNSPMLQQQNFSLEALAKRDAKEDPFKTADPPAAATPAVPAPDAPKDDAAVGKAHAEVLDRIAAFESVIKAIPTPEQIDYARIADDIGGRFAPVQAATEQASKEAFDAVMQRISVVESMCKAFPAPDSIREIVKAEVSAIPVPSPDELAAAGADKLCARILGNIAALQVPVAHV